MKKRLALALCALLGVLGLGFTGASPASASVCAIPGNWHQVTDPVNGHHACYRVFNQPVAGNPGLCWVTWYLQETLDYGTDQYNVSLRLSSYGSPFVIPQGGTTGQSAATVVKSGFFTVQVPWTSTCTDFSNPTQVQLKFNHPGNSGWQYGIVDWVD